MSNLGAKLDAFFKKLPSIAWVIILPLGIAAFIGGITLLFYLIANVEGIATVLMIVIGFFAFKTSNQVALQNSATKKVDEGFVLATGIVFFALMGMAIDQPGNAILNYPLNLFCENNSTFTRSVDILNPLPGRTDLIQDFSCYDDNGNFVNRIEVGYIIGARFVEYVIIGYGLHYLTRYLAKRNSQVPQTSPGTAT